VPNSDRRYRLALDARITELHCIMPMANVASVLAHGILSYERAAKLPHISVALQPVQDKRDQKQVPGGLRLHQYANLYFHARNPMLYKRLGEVESLCVLSISPEVLKLPGTAISDQNAVSDYVRFFHPSQSRFLDFDAIYAVDWRNVDRATYFRQKSCKCAEVLVPYMVEVKFVVGAYVVDSKAATKLQSLGFHLPVTINPVLFFRQVGGA
jgi:hypothetical protein